MKIRFFGTTGCKNCLKVFVLIKRCEIDFEYIDADEDENQEICDRYNVDELPHLQFLDDKNEILRELKGTVDEEDFLSCVIDVFL